MSAEHSRPRIDLDGIPLSDPSRPNTNLIAIFRHRTTAGLLLLMPESGEILVPYPAIARAEIDLLRGLVRIEFEASYAEHESWLRGARILTGRWLDRITL